MEIVRLLCVLTLNSFGNQYPTVNPNANGNAWFVSQIKTVSSADEEMKALDKFDSKNVAIVNTKEFTIQNKNFVKDASAVITLDDYKPNHLTYTSTNTNAGLAVFSEMYYAKGWKAYVDGKETPIYRADYVLRAIEIPAGKHQVEFKFEPQVVQTGSLIALVSSIGMLLLLVGGIYIERKKIKKIE